MFASHSQPYSIYARPAPACIMYGYTLPIPKVCQSFPDHFTQQVVYFNISKGQDNREFKFTMLVDSGKYTLTELAPVLIGCLDRCYELVSVTVNQKDTRVIHSGRGTIAVLDNPTVTVSNSYLTLGCQNGSECVVVLNASLAHGG